MLIRYYYKENGGMHTAVNLGASKAGGRFLLKADSDDLLAGNAVERVKHYVSTPLYRDNEEKLCGLVFLDGWPDGTVIGDKFRQDAFIGNYITERVNNKNRGDKTEVFSTAKFNEIPPFPEYPGEKRVASSSKWIRLAKKYDMLFINEIIYTRKYAADGISKNPAKFVFDSPLGMLHNMNERLTKEFRWKVRLRAAFTYGTFSYIARRKHGRKVRELAREAAHPMLVGLLLPFSFFRYLKYRRKHKDIIK